MSARTWSISVFMSVLGLAQAVANDAVPVPGSATRYPAATEIQVDGKPVKLSLTGAALRKRGPFSVYTVASYLQDGVAAKTPEQLAVADGVKVLHLIMERDVKGRDMAEAIQSGVRLNNPGNAFDAELRQIVQKLGSMDLRKGDNIFLIAIPKVGVRCQVVGKTDVLIQNPALSRAIWDIYLGRQNIGEPIKAGLVSRIKSEN
jgi:hypothetical protein